MPQERDSDRVGTPDVAAGAAGREGSVWNMLQQAYRWGSETVQGAFDGSLFRNVPTGRWQTALDTRPATGGGRSSSPGDRMIYGSPSAAESEAEAGAYRGMGGRTMVESHYHAAPDPKTGRGGVADVQAHLQGQGIPQRALTEPHGQAGPSFLHWLLGEQPYSMPRQVGRGARDAGASGVRVPSATGGSQLNVIPGNTDPANIRPVQRTPYDAAGMPGRALPATGAHPMPPAGTPARTGPIPMPAGEAGRASSARAGGAFGGLFGVGEDLWRRLSGEKVEARESATNVAVHAGTGAAGSKAVDLLTPMLGGGSRGAVRAGGLVDGLLSGGFSAADNLAAYRRGDVSGERAAANTLVDTGVGVGSGLAGAKLGALVGSAFPGLGTLVGAGLGFGAGIIGSAGARWLAGATGATDWAKDQVTSAIGGVGRGARNTVDLLSGQSVDRLRDATRAHTSGGPVMPRSSNAWQSTWEP